MGKQLRRTGTEIKSRWVQEMPPFFRMIVKLVACIAATAITVNTAVPAFGGTLYEWWGDVYTHILVGSICIIMICKLTVAGGYKDLDPDRLMRGRNAVDDGEEDADDDA